MEILFFPSLLLYIHINYNKNSIFKVYSLIISFFIIMFETYFLLFII